MKKEKLTAKQFYDEGFQPQQNGQYWKLNVKPLNIKHHFCSLETILWGKDSEGSFLALCWMSPERGWESVERRIKDFSAVDRLIGYLIRTEKAPKTLLLD